jgi:ABC-type transporter Mla maintaining outer membrane lipid asymmetry permease subunit MlaE
MVLRSKNFIYNEVNLISNFILPRMITGVFSNLTLSFVFAIMMIFSGYIFTFFIMGMDLHTYKYLVFNAINVSHIAILFIKSLFFGFFITSIAIYNALEPKKKNINPIFTLFFIEMVSFLFITLLKI